MSDMSDPQAPEPPLVLRRLGARDEQQARAGHGELAAEGFSFCPGLADVVARPGGGSLVRHYWVRTSSVERGGPGDRPIA